MKKIMYGIITLILFSPVNIFAFSEDIYSENYIMYNLETKQIILEENSNEQVSVASLTKIATAITSIELLSSLEDTVIITDETLEGLTQANASVAGFYVSQVLTVEDLLYGLMLPSGADAANALDIYLESLGYDIVEEMNNLVTKLELTNTNFSNTTGLEDENHYSTAYDISQILMYALENETFYTLFTTTSYLSSDASMTFKASYYSTTNYYDIDNSYIVGAKTGYTSQAGLCLASTSNFDETNFLLVTLGAARENYYTHILDANSIYTYVDTYYDYQLLYEADEIIKYINVENATVTQYNIKTPEEYYVYAEDDFNLDDYSYEYVGMQTISPNTDEDFIGTINVYYKEFLINSFEVHYDGSLEYSFQGFITEYQVQIIQSSILIGGALLILLITIKLIKRK